jgi:hypothetical protein
MEKVFDPQLLLLIVPLVVIQLILIVVCLVDLTHREKVKGLPKWAWGIIICLGELIGPIVYLLIGRVEE